MHSLTQQPDPEKFNFTKVDELKELVFVLKNLDETEQNHGRNVLYWLRIRRYWTHYVSLGEL